MKRTVSVCEYLCNQSQLCQIWSKVWRDMQSGKMRVTKSTIVIILNIGRYSRIMPKNRVYFNFQWFSYRLVLCVMYCVICISGCNPTFPLCKPLRTVVRFITGAVLESAVNETSYISAAESGRKQIMHHGRVYGLVEFSKDAEKSLLRNCTLQIVYDV